LTTKVSVFKRCPLWGLLTGFGVRGGLEHGNR
jgi:hypothetical protein